MTVALEHVHPARQPPNRLRGRVRSPGRGTFNHGGLFRERRTNTRTFYELLVGGDE
jgi:hypothetical protein